MGTVSVRFVSEIAIATFLCVAFFDREDGIVFVDRHQHQILAKFRTRARLALLAFALNSALGLVALFLLACVFLLAFGESGTASG